MGNGVLATVPQATAPILDSTEEMIYANDRMVGFLG
jgi:hypothetical protein